MKEREPENMEWKNKEGKIKHEWTGCNGLFDDGILDSGKTGFLKFTLKQDYFQIDGKTLLILCEDGEDEYDAMEMLRYGVVIERLEDREELTEEYLAELDRKHEAWSSCHWI